MSFRDPAGRLVEIDGRLLRILHPSAAADVVHFVRSPLARRLEREGMLVETRVVDDPESSLDVEALSSGTGLKSSFARDRAPGALLEHVRIPFPSYPYEWAPAMLYAAGDLTIDLAEAAIADRRTLKDATPFNILFRGPNPVFVDLPSFELRDPGLSIWPPYAQFLRTFVLPLLANRHFGLALRRVFESNREGLDPEDLLRLCSARQRLTPPFLGLVTVPALLSRRDGKSGGTARWQTVGRRSDPQAAEYVLKGILRHARRALRNARPSPGGSSAWTGYIASGPHAASYHEWKRASIAEVIREYRPATVLDVGCNDGHIARVAALEGARVVAIDTDEQVVDMAWRSAREEQLEILPLVVDLANPPPPTGWRNAECPSFLDRAMGRFEMALFLAVVHHLMVTAGIPLEEIIRLAADLTRDMAVIEFVPRDDPMFRRILRGRDALYEWYSEQSFRAACERCFRIVRVLEAPSGERRMFVLSK